MFFLLHIAFLVTFCLSIRFLEFSEKSMELKFITDMSPSQHINLQLALLNGCVVFQGVDLP